MRKPPPCAAGAMLLAAGILCTPGCIIANAVSLLFSSAVPIEAQYKIPKGQTVVVIVDDLRRAASPHLREGIASAAVFHLKTDDRIKVVGNDVVSDALSKLGDRWTGQHGQKQVSAASVGAALHADLVIYASIESAQIQLAENIYQPQVRLSIKAFEAAAGRCVFPANPDGDNIRASGYVIETDISPKDLSAGGRSAGAMAETKLGAQAGMDLAHVFMKHYPKQPGDTLGQP